MMRIAVFLTAILTACVFTAQAQIPICQSGRESRFVPQSWAFLPHNGVRGYTNFEVAPSHNEPDLGRCMFPQPASAGGPASACTAYARYMLSGYLELQPFGRTPARHIFFFFEPRISFGRNIPQLTYASSMEPIAYDRSIGIAFQLPR